MLGDPYPAASLERGLGLPRPLGWPALTQTTAHEMPPIDARCACSLLRSLEALVDAFAQAAEALAALHGQAARAGGGDLRELVSVANQLAIQCLELLFQQVRWLCKDIAAVLHAGRDPRSSITLRDTFAGLAFLCKHLAEAAARSQSTTDALLDRLASDAHAASLQRIELDPRSLGDGSGAGDSAVERARRALRHLPPALQRLRNGFDGAQRQLARFSDHDVGAGELEGHAARMMAQAWYDAEAVLFRHQASVAAGVLVALQDLLDADRRSRLGGGSGGRRFRFASL